MEKFLIEIGIQRFLPDKPLRYDLFIRLEKNNKILKILNSGESFDSQRLDKFKASLRSFFLKLESQESPENIDLYMSSPAEAAVVVTSAPEVVMTAENVAVKNSPPENTGNEKVVQASAATDDSTTISAGAIEAESQQAFAQSSEQATDTVLKTGATDETQKNTIISATSEQLTGTEIVLAGDDEVEDDETTVLNATSEQGDSSLYRIKSGIEKAVRADDSAKAISALASDENFETDLKIAFVGEKIAAEIVACPKEEKEKLNELVAENQRLVSAKSLPPDLEEKHFKQDQFDAFKTKIIGQVQQDPETALDSVHRMDASAKTARIKAEENTAEEAERIFQADTAPEKSEKITDPAHLKQNDLAVAAVTLAQLLGYSDANFLADLALSALISSEQVAGNKFSEEVKPGLLKLIESTDSERNIAVRDAKNILNLISTLTKIEDVRNVSFMQKLFSDGDSEIEFSDFDKSILMSRNPDEMPFDHYSQATRLGSQATKRVRALL